MGKFIIEGKEVELEGVESGTLVLVRPVEKASQKGIKSLAEGVKRLNEKFAAKYDVTFLVANKDIEFTPLAKVKS